jgi:hypothetical protein
MCIQHPKNKSPMLYARFEKPAQNIIDFNPQCQLAEPFKGCASVPFSSVPLTFVSIKREIFDASCCEILNTQQLKYRGISCNVHHMHTHDMCAGNWTQERKCHFQYSASEAQSLHRATSKAFLLIGDKGFIISQ